MVMNIRIKTFFPAKSRSFCDMFLNLALALQIEILASWLQLHDVAKLDSAFCSSQNRETFLNILHEECCVFDYHSKNLYGKHFWWLMKRNVKVSSVELLDQMVHVHRINLFLATGKYLRTLITSTVSFDNMSSIVLEISTICTNLERLVFSRNNLLLDDICSILSHLPQLQYLDLSHCHNLTGTMLANLNRCATSLRTLDFTECYVHEATITKHSFQEDHTLRTLNMTGANQLSSACLPFIRQCKALTTLFVDQLKLEEVFSILTQCPALTTLSACVDCAENRRLSEQELRTLISLIQNLEVLHFGHALTYDWSETQLATLIESVPNLRVLYAGRLNKRAPGAISEVIDRFKQFKKDLVLNSEVHCGCKHQLHTLHVDNISEREVLKILTICPQLVSFSMFSFTSNEGTTTPGPNFMTVLSHNIRILNITDCGDFSSSAIRPLHKLISLSLDHYESLQHDDLVTMLTQNKGLKVLELKWCLSLSQRSLLYIIENCHSLEELVFENKRDSLYQSTTSEMNTVLIEGLIKLCRPKLKFSLKLEHE